MWDYGTDNNLLQTEVELISNILFPIYIFIMGPRIYLRQNSGPMSLLRLTSDGGYFLIDGRTEFLLNEDDWITRAIDEVVMQ